MSLHATGDKRFRLSNLRDAVKGEYRTRQVMHDDWCERFLGDMECVQGLEDGSFAWVEPRRVWSFKKWA